MPFTQKFVVLRSPRPLMQDPFAGPRNGPLAGPMMAPAPGLVEDLNIQVEEDAPKAMQTLARERNVEAVAPVMPMKLIGPASAPVAAQAEAGVAWGIKAVGADTSPFDGSGVTVAVLDTGINKSHPAFNGVELVQRNFTDEAPEDKEGHGTHCAGTIFGRDVNGFRFGVARGIRKALIGKVLGRDGGASDKILEAIQWAVQEGAQVVSMSLGMAYTEYQAALQAQGLPAQIATSLALEGFRLNYLLFERMATLLRAQAQFGSPTLLVAAAGNESYRDVDPNFEVAVSPPAVAEGFVSVGALGDTDEGLQVADFSNTGPNISGPGVAITSAWLGQQFRTIDGTSMATPHVAGVAALWAQKIQQTGTLNILNFSSRLIASASRSAMKPGFDGADIGEGMVMAPQN